MPVAFVLVEPVDREENPDATVDMESAESRLSSVLSEDFRGGRPGGRRPSRGGALGGSGGWCFTTSGWGAPWRVEMLLDMDALLGIRRGCVGCVRSFTGGGRAGGGGGGGRVALVVTTGSNW